MPTRVLLLRHAETAQPHIFHGAESDVGLSQNGEEQVAKLAPWIAEQKPDVVVSSAMRRAVLTASPFAMACGFELHQEPQLHERAVGRLGGQPTRPPHPHWLETEQHWMAGLTQYTTPGAESFDAIRDRIIPTWNSLCSRFEGKSLVVVAHGVVIKVLLLTILEGWTVADWRRLGPMRNLGVTELEGGLGRWRAARINEFPHILTST